jgi:hypothetical protein
LSFACFRLKKKGLRIWAADFQNIESSRSNPVQLGFSAVQLNHIQPLAIRIQLKEKGDLFPRPADFQ